MSGTQISDMTDSLTDFPDGSFVPFVVETNVGGLVTTTNYRYNAGARFETTDAAIALRPTSATLAATGGSALIGFIQDGTGAVASDLETQLRMLAVTPQQFGAVGDGVTDDHAAFVLALAFCALTKQRLFIPRGTYLISDTLVVGHANAEIVGEGWGDSILLAGSAAPIMLVSARYSLIQGVGFQGGVDASNKVAVHGLVYQDGAGGNLVRCAAYWFTSHGVMFDPVWDALPDGNNNNIVVSGGDFILNDGTGLWVELHPDENDISFLNVNSSSNDGHGIMLKGEGHVVNGGNIFANGLYGVQISESGDSVVSTNSRVSNAWIEANFSGGVRGGGMSQRNIYYQKNNAQSYTADTGSADVYIRATGTGVLDLYGNGTEIMQVSANSTAIFQSVGTVSGSGNRDWWRTPQGTGSLVENANVNITSGHVLQVDGTQVVTARQSAVADASGGATVDAEARTAINTLLARIRTHGLIAT